MREVTRPWGLFKRFTLNEKSTVKILHVNPHGILSLQKHKNRKEMWYFLTDGWVQIGKKTKKIKKGEIINVRKKVNNVSVNNKNECPMEIRSVKIIVTANKGIIAASNKWRPRT